MALARADLESLLRARQLDRTLTTSLPALDPRDEAAAAAQALRRLPFTTWMRLQRMVEGTQTACVLIGSQPMARSAAGLTLQLGIRDSGLGIRFGDLLFDGLTVEARVIRARAR